MFPILTTAMWAVGALALLGPAIEFVRTGMPNWEQWGDEILAYTTDPRGLKRFAKALRGLLLSRHSG